MEYRTGRRGEEQGQSYEPARDSRSKTTGWIWFWATLMMGPSVPIAYFSQSSAVPLFVIAGAALSSAAVWAFGGSPSRRGEQEKQALEQAVAECARLKAQSQEMEERLYALETMTRYERASLERRESQEAQRRAEEARFNAPHEAFDEALSSAPATPARPRPGREYERQG